MKNLTTLFLVMATLLLSTSCSKEEKGCTQIFAENYDPAATENDGSCISISERFLGTYDAVQECDESSSVASELTIFENPDSESPVRMILNSEEIPNLGVSIFNAYLEPENNCLIFALEKTNVPNLGPTSISGIGKLVDNVLTIDFTRTYTDSDVQISEECTIVATKN